MKDYKNLGLLDCLEADIDIYYSYLYYRRTLEIEEKFKGLTIDKQNTLEWLQQVLPPTTSTLAEPLVPVFESLAAFNPVDPRHNVVLPTLPTLPGATAANHGSLHDECVPLLPNIVAATKRRIRMAQDQGAVVGLAHGVRNPNTNIHAPAGNDVPFAHNAAGLNSQAMIIPNGLPFTGFSDPQRVRLLNAHNAEGPDLPPGYGAANAVAAGVNNDAQVNTWYNYLRCGPQMFRYLTQCRVANENYIVPYKNNSTIARIPLINNGDASIVQRYNHNGVAYADANASRLQATGYLEATTDPNHGRQPALETPVGKKFGGLQHLTVCRSLLTKINVRFIGNYYPNINRIGALIAANAPYDGGQNTLSGPFWNPNETPRYFTVPEHDNGPSIMSTVTAYFAGKRLRR